MVSFVVSLGRPEIEVPFVIGRDKLDAGAQLDALGFKVTLEEEESDELKDVVVRTDPAQGEVVAEGTTVTVYFSDGREEVPDVVGMTQPQAKNAIRNAGFEPRVVERSDTTEPAGTVIRQSPEAGETPSEGSTITIEVSTFVEPTETPSPSETPSGDPTETLPPITERGLPPAALSPTRRTAARRSSGRPGRRTPER